MSRRWLWLLASLMAGCTTPNTGGGWRAKPPPVSRRAVFHPATADTHELANGVGVWVSKLDHTTTTRVGLVFGRGHAGPQPAPDAVRVLARWLEFEAEGAQSERFDALGADLRVTAHASTTRLEVDVLNADVPQAMTALAELVANAGDEAAFEAAVRMQLGSVARLRRTPERVAVSAALQAMFGREHAGLDPLSFGSEASLQRVRFQDVLDTRNAWTAGVAASWVVVGPHEPKTVRAWAWAVSESWPEREPRAAPMADLPARSGTVTIVPIADLDPALVVVSKSLRGTHRRTATETAFAAGLGLANARLREGAQQTYGIQHRLIDDGSIHAAVATTRVPASRAAEAATLVVESFLAAVPYVDDEPLARSQRSDSLRASTAAVETSVRADALYQALAGGAPLDAVPPFGPLPIPPSAARVRHALQTEFTPNDFHIVLAGDRRILESQLQGSTYRVRTVFELIPFALVPDDT